MKRTIVLAVVAVGIGGAMSVLSQASGPDSSAIQAILSELRGIHKDMRTTAISQILLTELQTQQTVVNAATARVNSARIDLSNLQADEQKTSAALADSQDHWANESDPNRKGAFSAVAAEHRAELSALRTKEDGLSTNLRAAENQLRLAQDTLDDIQRRLDETVKRLQPIADTR